MHARKTCGFPRSRAVYAPLRFVLNKRHWRLAPLYIRQNNCFGEQAPRCHYFTVCALLNWITDTLIQTDNRLFLFSSESVSVSMTQKSSLFITSFISSRMGFKVCHMGRDSAAGKVPLVDGADGLLGCLCRRRVPVIVRNMCRWYLPFRYS